MLEQDLKLKPWNLPAAFFVLQKAATEYLTRQFAKNIIKWDKWISPEFQISTKYRITNTYKIGIGENNMVSSIHTCTTGI